MLLFGKDPQFFIPQSGLVYVRFAGTEPRGPGGLPGYTRREEFNGALARVIENCWSILLTELRGEAVVRGLKREDRHVYPQFAVREALVNAVCHRDYRLTGKRVEIRQFDDRLEISSPGGLPGYITLDNIVEEHFSRNPRLVNGLFEWGYIEQLGLGIDRMIEEMVQGGHPAPEFKPTPLLLHRGAAARQRPPATARHARMGHRPQRASDPGDPVSAALWPHYQPRVPRALPRRHPRDAAPGPGRSGGQGAGDEDRGQEGHVLRLEAGRITQQITQIHLGYFGINLVP